MSRSAGTCNTMGTASTMACMAEALGTSLPHNAAIPAVDARRYVLAQMSGSANRGDGEEGLTLSKILTRQSFENAIRTNAAIGGSTNAVIHLKAIAGPHRRAVGTGGLDPHRSRHANGRRSAAVRPIPDGGVLLCRRPSGGAAQAGRDGLLPHPDALTVNGRRIWENVKEAPCFNDEVIRPLDKPLIADGGICMLRGNLSPRGAVLKPSAASPELLKHRGRAVVFENFEHYKEPDRSTKSLDVDASSRACDEELRPQGVSLAWQKSATWVCRQKLLRQGVKDMVRVSDARMSGTAYGTVVLHVAPEAADGGPLAVVRDGDWIELDCAGRASAPGHQRCRAGRTAPGDCSRRALRWTRAGATAGYTLTTSYRPTRAVISTSWSVAGAPK